MDDQYKQGLITGLAMHPLYVGTIFKKVNTAYFGFSGNDPDGLCDSSSPLGFATTEGLLSDNSTSALLKNGEFVDKTGFTGYYDMTSVNEDATLWKNKIISNVGPIILNNSFFDGRELTINANGYGEVEMEEPNTIYCCFKSSDLSTPSNYWHAIFTKHLESSSIQQYHAFDFFIYKPNKTHAFSTIGIEWYSNIPNDKYVLFCITRGSKTIDLNDIDNPDDNVTYSKYVSLYLNGVLIARHPDMGSGLETNETNPHKCQWGNYMGRYYLNACNRNGDDAYLSKYAYPASFKLLAFGNSPHSAEQVKANTEAFFTQLREDG